MNIFCNCSLLTSPSLYPFGILLVVVVVIVIIYYILYYILYYIHIYIYTYIHIYYSHVRVSPIGWYHYVILYTTKILPCQVKNAFCLIKVIFCLNPCVSLCPTIYTTTSTNSTISPHTPISCTITTNTLLLTNY